LITSTTKFCSRNHQSKRNNYFCSKWCSNITDERIGDRKCYIIPGWPDWALFHQ